MKALLLSLCAVAALAVAPTPARAGLFSRDPSQIKPYARYGSVWRFYNYDYKGRFHPQGSFKYLGWRQ